MGVLRLIFRPRLNHADVLVLSIGAVLCMNGHWVIGLGMNFIFPFISALIELSLFKDKK